LILVAVGRHVAHTWSDLRGRGESIRVEPAFFALAIALYIAGLIPFGIFYGRVLEATSRPIRRLAAVRAYVISHLGKYVPGKALVVVIRAAHSIPHGARGATAAFATLYDSTKRC
jgi:hypothetical protein